MTHRAAQLSVLALAVASCVSSCAAPTITQPKMGGRSAHGLPATAATRTTKKAVRMNGRGAISSISLDEFFPLHQSGKVLIYDARPGFFYHLGHIPGAISLPKNGCDDAIIARQSEIQAALAAGHPIVVYCTNCVCPDARTLAIHLSGFGYPTSIFSGGWEAWRQADMPGQ